MSHSQGAHRIEDGEDGDTNVGKDGQPHGSDTQSGEDEYGDLDADGKPDILTGNGQRATGDTDGKCDFRGFVVHQHHISSLDSGIRAKSTHSDTDISARQDRSIIDTITNKSKILAFRLFRQQTLDMSDFISRQQFCMIFIQTELLSDILCYLLSIAC